jgi:hypothetical protein
VAELLEAQNLDAEISARVTVFAVKVELRARESGVSDEPFHPFVGKLKTELAPLLSGRALRVALREFGPEERFQSPRRDRGDRRGRHEDRGHGRFDRGPRRSRPPEDNGERDERLRGRARRAIEKVMSGDGPATLADLNSYERRLVHMEVREFDGVVSHSVGEGSHKEVLIERSNSED